MTGPTLCDGCYNQIISGERFVQTELNILCGHCAEANGISVNRLMVDHSTGRVLASELAKVAQ